METRTVSGTRGIAAVVGSIISILLVINGIYPLPFIENLVQHQNDIVEFLTAIFSAGVVLYTAASSPPPWLRSLFFWKRPLPPGPEA